MQVLLNRDWHKRRKCIPRKECNHCQMLAYHLRGADTCDGPLTEAEPGKEEHSSILVERIENGDRASLSIDGVDLGCLPECFDSEAHIGRG